MPDSFTELRGHGGSNKPWIAAGVSALAVALILIALAGAWWSAQPAPESTVPATVTVTAQQEPLLSDKSVTGTFPGTYSGTLNSLEEDPKVAAWPAVATFGSDGSGQITYPLTGCTALIGPDGTSTPLTKKCVAGGGGAWLVEKQAPGIVKLTYSEGGNALVEGELSLGAP